MEFKLEQLENHVSENAFVKGELLFEQDGIQSLFEVEKHLWLARVEDREVYEVEIKISPSKVEGMSCECSDFAKNKACAHTVACLLAIRKQIRNKAIPKTPKTTSNSQKKLTTRSILQQVDTEDLLDFVREYAQKNRNFAIALKARFASAISGLDSRQKYRQLLDTTINAARKSDRSISKRGILKINKVLRELEKQNEAAMLSRHYTTAFAISRSIIEKITPILKKVVEDSEELNSFLDKAFQSLAKLSTTLIAPELKQEIFNYALEEAPKRVFRMESLDDQFFALAWKLADEESEKQLLFQLLKRQEDRYQKEGFSPIRFLQQYYKILDEAPFAMQAQALIDRQIQIPELLIFALKTAIFNQEASKAKQLALKGLEQNYHPTYIFQLEELLLQISQATADNAAVIKFAEKRFLATLQEKYYEILQEAHPKKNWKKFVDQLLQKLNNLPYSIEKPAAVAHVLIQEGRKKALEKHLRESRSIELLYRFGNQIADRPTEVLHSIYHQILNTYLHNHLGRTPSQKIKRIIAQLHENNRSEVAAQLVQEFRDQYAERHSLMEELAWF